MASRYFINGGVDSNWGSTSNWSLTDGGAGGETVPTASDDVFFTANSPACTVDTSSRVALTLNFTGYTNTITMTNGITVSGSVTLVAAMTIAGTGALICNATATLTSNGKTWPNNLTFNPTFQEVFTLADDWTISGTFSTSSTNSQTINGNTLYIGAGCTIGNPNLFGTTTIRMTGTGTISTGAVNLIYLPVTFDSAAGTITVGQCNFNCDILTYIQGTMVTTGPVIFSNGSYLVGVTQNINTSGMNWTCNVTFYGAIATTLESDFNSTSGTVTYGQGVGSGYAPLRGAYNLNVSQHLVANGSNDTHSVVTINLIGTGTLSSTSTAHFKDDIVFNTAGTITISGTINLGGSGVLTYTAGTIVTTSSTLSVYGACTLDTNGIAWNDVSFVGAATYTLSSILDIDGTFTSGNQTKTLNGSQINASGNITLSNTTTNASGTTVFNLDGSNQTVSSAMTSGRWSNNITIASTGSVFFTTGFKYSGIMTHTSGKVLGLIDIDYPPVPSSVIFGGTDEYVDISGILSLLTASTSGTWAAWVKGDTLASFLSVGNTGANTQILFQIITAGSNFLRILAVDGGVTKYDLRTTVVTPGFNYLHVAVTHNGTAPVLYLNGSAVAQSYTTDVDRTFWVDNLTTPNSVFIGRNANNSPAYSTPGNVGWVTFWNTALSAAQITTLYNSGQQITPVNNLPAYANIVSHFNLGLGDTFPTATDSVGGNNGTYTNMEASDILIINRTIASAF